MHALVERIAHSLNVNGYTLCVQKWPFVFAYMTSNNMRQSINENQPPPPWKFRIHLLRALKSCAFLRIWSDKTTQRRAYQHSIGLLNLLACVFSSFFFVFFDFFSFFPTISSSFFPFFLFLNHERKSVDKVSDIFFSSNKHMFFEYLLSILFIFVHFWTKLKKIPFIWSTHLMDIHQTKQMHCEMRIKPRSIRSTYLYWFCSIFILVGNEIDVVAFIVAIPWILLKTTTNYAIIAVKILHEQKKAQYAKKFKLFTFWNGNLVDVFSCGFWLCDGHKF